MGQHRTELQILLDEQREFNKRYLKQMARLEKVTLRLANKLDKGMVWK